MPMTSTETSKKCKEKQKLYNYDTNLHSYISLITGIISDIHS